MRPLPDASLLLSTKKTTRRHSPAAPAPLVHVLEAGAGPTFLQRVGLKRIERCVHRRNARSPARLAPSINQRQRLHTHTKRRDRGHMTLNNFSPLLP